MEAQDDLIKTKEELHMVMTVPPPPPPPPVYDHLDDNSDSEENASMNSADLQMEGINDHRMEEDRLTEAEKNERVQTQLKVRYPREKEGDSVCPPFYSYSHHIVKIKCPRHYFLLIILHFVNANLALICEDANLFMIHKCPQSHFIPVFEMLRL